MTDNYRHIVALGSSYAAGPGIEPTIDKAAMRSGRNYAHLLAGALQADLVDATVSGATTTTILDAPQRAGTTRFAPQIESVHTDTDLVTVTAGGNDLGYLGSVLSASVADRLRRTVVARPLAWALQTAFPSAEPSAEKIATATAGLARIVAEARRRAPRARVVLVDYLPIFAGDAVPGPEIPFTAGELARFRRIGETLAGVYRAAAEQSGAELVPASAYAAGHELGTTEPWVFGLRLRQLGSSYHPTAAGMQAVADQVLRLLDHPRAPASRAAS